jgi:hypothetical protein
MADTKISGLSAISAVADEDLLAMVDDPSGTPASTKATVGQLRTQLDFIDATPDTDHTVEGPHTNSISAGATIAQFDLVYLHTDGEWALVDADALATSGDVMLGLALEAGTDGNPMDTALHGAFVRDDTWTWTAGDILYASTTAGGLTTTAPSGTGDVVRTVGYAITADIVHFLPSSSWVVVA